MTVTLKPKRYARAGYARAARELGCTPSHLRQVVLGHRKTPLLARYQAWLSTKAETDQNPKKQNPRYEIEKP